LSARDVRHRLRRRLVETRWLLSLLVLPPRVAWFQLRARRMARGTGDLLSLTSVTRPRDLRTLLSVARGRQRVVELGTATGWTAISLALADRSRTVTSYDVVERAEPHRYLELIAPAVRDRIGLLTGSGSDGPRDPTGRDVDLLYIDSSHERAQTIAEVQAWRAFLRPGAVIVFDDYDHPEYPGVGEAVAELGLAGRQRGTLFIHPVGDPPADRP
jgi:predicted O-methyltransferase YrrM